MTTQIRMTTGQWYTIRLSQSGDVPAYLYDVTSSQVRLLSALSAAPAQQFRAISLDGHLFDVNQHSVDRLGIGGLRYITPQPEPLSAEDILALHGKRMQAQKKQQDDYEAENKAKTAEMNSLPGRFPELRTNATSGKWGATLAAQNIRIEIKKAFPGVKFAVTSERYTGGDSVDINWTNGPTSAQVRAITTKYEDGSFDGMTDSYDYKKDGRSWREVFGGAKYVSENRHWSDEGITTAWQRAGHKETITNTNNMREEWLMDGAKIDECWSRSAKDTWSNCDLR